MMGKAKRYAIPIIALLALLFAIRFSVSRTPVRTPTAPPAAPPQAASSDVVAAEGLVEPVSENIALNVPVPGMIMAVYVNAGNAVRHGQPLFKLDDRDLVADLGVKRAALDIAKAQLDKLEQSPRPEEIPPLEAKVTEAKAELADAAVQVRLIDSVTDKRAVRQEDVLRRHLNFDAARARVAQAQSQLALLKAGTWKEDLLIARAQVAQAAAAVRQNEINIDRLTVRAPADGMIMQSKVRLGQYAQAGVLAEPLMVFGAGVGLHVRADVDESDAWRVRSGARATARLRGNSRISFPLSFVRFEPYVVPKRSLTGNVTERVDTRVLEVIYRISDPAASVFNGQQVDVFIDAHPASVASAAK